MRAIASIPLLAVIALGCTPPEPKRAEPPREDAPRQRVFVGLTGSQGALVRELRDKDDVVCLSPCDRVITVQKDEHFRITSPGALPTKSFTLYSPEDPVAWVDYRARSRGTHKALRIAAISSLIVGGVLSTIAVAGGVGFKEGHPARQPIFITGAIGFLGFLPLGGILGGVAYGLESSSIDFKDPRTRADPRPP